LSPFKAKPVQKVTLISHDIGSLIGCKLNYAYPDLLHGFVMMNVPNPNTITGMLKNGTLNVSKLLRTPFVF
jgi:pimeloyl-ACP methyl ester carboxylesterase